MKRKRLNFMFSFILILFLSLFAVISCRNASAQVPIPEPTVPCDETRSQEFHSLRPYQASPCNQDAEDLALFCGNDFILLDTIVITKTYSSGTTPDYEYPITWEYSFEGEPINPSQEQPPNSELACSYCNQDGECVTRTYGCIPELGCSDSSECIAECTDNGDGTETCYFIVGREVDIAIDLSGAELPIMGYTEPSQGTTDPYTVINSINSDETLADPAKVNEYVSWYLNGTIGRAEYDPPDMDEEEGREKIVNFSGPLKRLMAFESQLVTRSEQVEDAVTSLDCDSNETDPSDPECIRHDQKVEGNTRLSYWENHLPPLRRAFNDFEDYIDDFVSWWNNFRGELFSFIPFSSTEDRKGEVEISEYTIQPPTTGTAVILNSAITNQVPADLFFAHMQESVDLADLLQSIYSPQEANLDADAFGVVPSYAPQCNIVEYRKNPGDNLFAGELTATFEYTAQVTCTYTHPGDGRLCTAIGGTCYAGDQEDWNCDTYYDQIDCNPGSFCGEGCNRPPLNCVDRGEICFDFIRNQVYPCCPGLLCPIDRTANQYCESDPLSISELDYTETCTTQVTISFRTVTKTPLADEVWSKLVAGPAGAFRRIFPQIEDEEGRPIRRLWDIPAATNVTYSVLTGNVSVATPDPKLFFPHIGGVHEYFLNCIQKTLRPQGYGQGCISAPLSTNPVSDSCPAVPDSQIPGEYLGYMKEHFMWLADIWCAGCTGSENNLAEECYNYVVSEAVVAGVNPAFALTIWVNESGASNYCCGGSTTQDFGYNIPSLYMNLEGQLEGFLGMAQQQYCVGIPGFTENMHRWLSRYQSSTGGCDPNDPVATDYYEDVRDFTWQVVTEPIRVCVVGTSFGIDWPTDSSCP